MLAACSGKAGSSIKTVMDMTPSTSRTSSKRKLAGVTEGVDSIALKVESKRTQKRKMAMTTTTTTTETPAVASLVETQVMTLDGTDGHHCMFPLW